MAILNKTCCVCGEKYEYCYNCSSSLMQPTWKQSFCSENCKNIYEICAGYAAGHIEKEAAITLLKMCDLSHKDHFTVSTQKLIDELTSAVKQPVSSIPYNKNNKKKR